MFDACGHPCPVPWRLQGWSAFVARPLRMSVVKPCSVPRDEGSQSHARGATIPTYEASGGDRKPTDQRVSDPDDQLGRPMIWAAVIARLLVGIALATAATAKIVDRRSFTDSLQYFGIPPGWRPAVATVILGVESGVAVALVGGLALPVSAFVAAALLILFTMATMPLMLGNGSVACSCFGTLFRERLGPTTVVRNAFLASLAVIAALEPIHLFSAELLLRPNGRAIGSSPAVIDLLPVGILVTLTVMAYLLFIRLFGFEDVDEDQPQARTYWQGVWLWKESGSQAT